MTSTDKLLLCFCIAAPLLTIAASVGHNTKATTPTPAPAPVAAPVAPQAPAYTLRDLMLSGAADLAADKDRHVLKRSRNAPSVKLYDTQASHPACTINGKPMQVAEAGNGGFTCYRWVGDTVALRIDGNRFVMMDGDNFR